jgi:hypothetical protein
MKNQAPKGVHGNEKSRVKLDEDRLIEKFISPGFRRPCGVPVQIAH